MRSTHTLQADDDIYSLIFSLSSLLHGTAETLIFTLLSSQKEKKAHLLFPPLHKFKDVFMSREGREKEGKSLNPKRGETRNLFPTLCGSNGVSLSSLRGKATRDQSVEESFDTLLGSPHSSPAQAKTRS